MTAMLKYLFPVLTLCLGLGATSAFGAEAIRLTNALPVYVDETGKPMNRPEGVACHDDAFAVADSENGRLLYYELSRGSLQGGKALAFPELPFPLRIHFNSSGDLLVFDGKSRRLAKINAQENLLAFIQPEGIPGDRTPFWRSFAVDKNDNLYMLDIFGARVVMLDADGRYIREIPFPEDFGFMSDLMVNQLGTVYLLDSVKHTVFAAEAGAENFTALTSDLRDYLNFPTAISTDNQGNVFVVDRNGGGIVTLGVDGTYRGRQLTLGWKPGLLYYPTQLCITANDEAIIADRDNNRVQIFNVSR